MILWLFACSFSPYPDYWSDRTAYPIVKRVSPSSIPSRSGGQTIQIEGRQLSNTTTVVVGGRNAEIISVDDRMVQIRMPDLPAGSGAVAISVVTGKGASTQEGALTVSTPISTYVEEESMSVSVLQLDCPIEAWGAYGDEDERYPYSWCGAEMGYASAEAWDGIGSQPGYAAEIASISPISELPVLGRTRVYGPGERRSPGVPLMFGAHGEKEGLRLERSRDLNLDVLKFDERKMLFQDTYSWRDSITAWRSMEATLFDEEQCWLETLDVEEVTETGFILSGDADGATFMTIGFSFEEDYGDYVYSESATAYGMSIVADGRVVEADPARIDLEYDVQSGWFLPDTYLGPVDFTPGEYTVSTTDSSGRRETVGYMLGMTPFDWWSVSPQLMSGYEEIDVTDNFEVTWSPAPDTVSPTIVAVEIAVYDMDVVGPDGPALVSRLVAGAADTDGEIMLSSVDLSRLPLAPNRWDEWDEATGYWGDMTVTRHELRKVRRAQGDIVVDFIHAINGPLMLTDGN